MNEVLAVGLQSMQGDMARVDQIANNMANVLTPAYKAGIALQSPLGSSFAAHLAQAADLAQGGSATAAIERTSDMRAGSLKATGRTLDIALMDRGYFEVLTETGLAYTRQGNLQLDARGRLVTAQGYPVMGEAGEMVLNAGDPVIGSNGDVSAAGATRASGTSGASVGQLKVVEFDDATGMERLGNGLFSAGTGLKPVPAAQMQVRQGYLENSNASSTHEMTHLIQVMRHFESMQKMVVGYDEMLGVAIRKLGETS